MLTGTNEGDSETYVSPYPLIDMAFCSKFANMPLSDILALDIYNVRLILISALQQELMQSESGRQQLKEYFLYSKHNVDIEAEKLESFLGSL